MPLGTDSSTTRKLPLRRRPDLIVQPVWYGTQCYWVVKDPVSLRFYQLREEEYTILQMLDGRHSLEEIQTAVERRFAPQRVRIEQIQAFLGMLHREGLVVADAPGQGQMLQERLSDQRRRTWWRPLANPLAIRFPGFNPHWVLKLLYPEFCWLFSPLFFLLAILLAGSALLLCAVQFDTLLARLPDFHDFFNFRNAIVLLAALAVIKILHELGHGLACKHFGGECHEMGVMLLVFTPCLYCNVSDAWLLTSKWRRIAISAAGMYVEMILASLATFLWWFTQPGPLNSLCLDVMFICSVSTVLFNGNPLLRYDGYYILADLLEVPNLRPQAGAVVRRAAARWFTGVQVAHERMLPERRRGLLATYFVASVAYRWFVVILILWVLHKAAEPYRLEVLVGLLALTVVAGLVASPLVQSVKFLRNPLRSRQVKWFRLMLRGGVVAGLIAAVSLVPLPYRVSAPVVVRPQGAHNVYVSVPGTLRTAIQPGMPVRAEDELAQLVNYEIALKVAEYQGKHVAQQRRVEALIRREQAGDKEAEAELPTAKKVLEQFASLLAKHREDQQRLTLRAPIAGTVLPPPRKLRETTEDEPETWSGTPLDEHNRGSFLERRTLLCQIGDPSRLEAVLVIDQADVDFVHTGQRVCVALDAAPRQFLWGTITEMSELDLDVVPRELIGEEELAMRTDKSGLPRPLSASYQARVQLDDAAPGLRIGATGHAKIHAPDQPLAMRLYRYLRRTLRIEL